jgi:hypothetical protein
MSESESVSVDRNVDRLWMQVPGMRKLCLFRRSHVTDLFSSLGKHFIRN